MPPSGVLVALCPAEYSGNNGSNNNGNGSSATGASGALSPKPPAAAAAAAVAAEPATEKDATVCPPPRQPPAPLSSLSSFAPLSPSHRYSARVAMERIAPFLEMEEDSGSDDDEEDDEDDALLQDVVLEDIALDDEEGEASNCQIVNRDTTTNPAASLIGNQTLPLPPGKGAKQQDDNGNGNVDHETNSPNYDKGSWMPFSHPLKTAPRDGLPWKAPRNNACCSPGSCGRNHDDGFGDSSIKSCGKRQRTHRRVTFPSGPIPFARPSSSSPTNDDNNNTCDASGQPNKFPSRNPQGNSKDNNHYNYNYSNSNSNKTISSNPLVRVRDTIHRSEFTNEERLATWYTFDDLRSFKRDRKDTARMIDNGVLSLPFSPYEPMCPTNKPAGKEEKENKGETGDASSLAKPGETLGHCARGCENCTEAIGRTRYRRIAEGWRAVLNAQKKHRYEQQKMKAMTSAEQNQFRTLASLFGSGSKRPPRADHRTNAHGSETLCCPHALAEAYKPASMASLDIAWSRAIGDEREAAKLKKPGLPERQHDPPPSREQPVEPKAGRDPAQQNRTDGTASIAAATGPAGGDSGCRTGNGNASGGDPCAPPTSPRAGEGVAGEEHEATPVAVPVAVPMATQ